MNRLTRLNLHFLLIFDSSAKRDTFNIANDNSSLKAMYLFYFHKFMFATREHYFYMRNSFLPSVCVSLCNVMPPEKSYSNKRQFALTHSAMVVFYTLQYVQWISMWSTLVLLSISRLFSFYWNKKRKSDEIVQLIFYKFSLHCNAFYWRVRCIEIVPRILKNQAKAMKNTLKWFQIKRKCCGNEFDYS